jgi:hypothetical protein
MERRGFFGTLVGVLTFGFLPRKSKAQTFLNEYKNTQWKTVSEWLVLPGVGNITTIKRSGYQAAVGIEWVNSVTSFAQLRQFIMVEEKFARSENTRLGTPDHDVNHARREAAIASVLELIGKNFQQVAGQDAKPQDWVLIQLEGWWLHETPVPVVPGQHSIKATFIDCTYAFVPKHIADLPYGGKGYTPPPELEIEIDELNRKHRSLLPPRKPIA